MTLHSYLLFVGACIVLCAVPGPDMLLLLTRSVAQGRKAGMVTALGCNAGAYLHLLAATFGLSALVATSPQAFWLVKLAGAGYLAWLGLRSLLSGTGPFSLASEGVATLSWRDCFWQGFWSDVLNPKVAVFYLAFLPQFVVPGGSTMTQMLFLGVTTNMVGIVFAALVVVFAAALTTRLRNDARIAWWLAKGLGLMFVALGVRLLFESP